MAKKSMKSALLLGAATAVVSGIAAYKHRKEIERTVQVISDQITAKLEDEEGFFVAETVEEAPTEGETIAAGSEPPVVDESDLAD